MGGKERQGKADRVKPSKGGSAGRSGLEIVKMQHGGKKGQASSRWEYQVPADNVKTTKLSVQPEGDVSNANITEDPEKSRVERGGEDGSVATFPPRSFRKPANRRPAMGVGARSASKKRRLRPRSLRKKKKGVLEMREILGRVLRFLTANKKKIGVREIVGRVCGQGPVTLKATTRKRDTRYSSRKGEEIRGGGETITNSDEAPVHLCGAAFGRQRGTVVKGAPNDDRQRGGKINTISILSASRETPWREKGKG